MCKTCLVERQSEEVVGPLETPVYTIGVAAEILGVHPRTLRIYEQKNLLLPARRANWRYFSKRDLVWARGIRYLLHGVGMSVEGLQRALGSIPCWELLPCSKSERQSCSKADNKRTPCWAVAPRPDNKCYKCRVYQAAPAWLLEANELAAIESFSNGTS
ncbi:MerR family transcriptional regulator [Candidatus Bipolaricaulota bacterium]